METNLPIINNHFTSRARGIATDSAQRYPAAMSHVGRLVLPGIPQTAHTHRSQYTDGQPHVLLDGHVAKQADATKRAPRTL
eukprot:6683266-Prymnesium_polylepis.1